MFSSDRITHSVERIKRILDHAGEVKSGGSRSTTASAAGSSDTLQKYSAILTEAYNAVTRLKLTFKDLGTQCQRKPQLFDFLALSSSSS